MNPCVSHVKLVSDSHANRQVENLPSFQHAQITAIGEAVHVASRLQELTKEYRCQLVVSDVVGTVAAIPLGDFPRHDIQVRGLSAPLAIRVIASAARLAHYELPHPSSETERGGDLTDRSAPAYEQSA